MRLYFLAILLCSLNTQAMKRGFEPDKQEQQDEPALKRGREPAGEVLDDYNVYNIRLYRDRGPGRLQSHQEIAKYFRTFEFAIQYILSNDEPIDWDVFHQARHAAVQHELELDGDRVGIARKYDVNRECLQRIKLSPQYLPIVPLLRAYDVANIRIYKNSSGNLSSNKDIATYFRTFEFAVEYILNNKGIVDWDKFYDDRETKIFEDLKASINRNLIARKYGVEQSYLQHLSPHSVLEPEKNEEPKPLTVQTPRPLRLGAPSSHSSPSADVDMDMDMDEEGSEAETESLQSLTDDDDEEDYIPDEDQPPSPREKTATRKRDGFRIPDEVNAAIRAALFEEQEKFNSGAKTRHLEEIAQDFGVDGATISRRKQALGLTFRRQ